MASSNTLPLFDRTNSRSHSPALRSILGHTASLQYGNSKNKYFFPSIAVSSRPCREDGAVNETEPHVLGKGVAGREEVESDTKPAVLRPAENLDDGKHPGPLRSSPSKDAPIAVKFINNPYGTPLTTIVEQKSRTTLETESSKSLKIRKAQDGSSCKRQKQAPLDVDEVTLREFRRIFHRNESSEYGLSSNVGSDAQAGGEYPPRPVSPQDSACIRSATSPRRLESLLDNSKHPLCLSHSSQKLTHWSSRCILRSVRDFFRITIPAEHGQTTFARHNIDDWSRKAPSKEGRASACQQPNSVPREVDRGSCHSISRPTSTQLDTKCSSRRPPRRSHNIEAAESDQPQQGSSNSEACIQLHLALRNRDDLESRHVSTSIPKYRSSASVMRKLDRSRQSSHSTLHTAPIETKETQERGPISSTTPPSNQESLQKTRTAVAHLLQASENPQSSPHVRFSDFPHPLPSRSHTTSPINPFLHPSRNTVIHTFHSAALESLLPIAASQGIVRAYYPSPDASGEFKDKFLSCDKTSHLDLGILYQRGSVCPHRMANYTESDTLQCQQFLDQMESASVDGAVEVREKKDWCWRCRVEGRVRRVMELLDMADCRGGRNDETIGSVDV